MRKIQHVKEAYVIYGMYDVIAKVEADTMDKLREVITSKVRRVNNVGSTLTVTVYSVPAVLSGRARLWKLQYRTNDTKCR